MARNLSWVQIWPTLHIVKLKVGVRKNRKFFIFRPLTLFKIYILKLDYLWTDPDRTRPNSSKYTLIATSYPISKKRNLVNLSALAWFRRLFEDKKWILLRNKALLWGDRRVSDLQNNFKIRLIYKNSGSNMKW